MFQFFFSDLQFYIITRSLYNKIQKIPYKLVKFSQDTLCFWVLEFSQKHHVKNTTLVTIMTFVKNNLMDIK